MIFPSRAFYRPGEKAVIAIPGAFHAQIWHLNTCVAIVEGADEMRWLPPAESKRGYRVCAETSDGIQWTAFDVLDSWTQAPRYGYVFDFRPERSDFDMDSLLARHINGLQFYDWMYRHDTLLPPQTVFDDPLGRSMSLDTVRSWITAAHTHGMAAMPYTAVYAASPAFAAAHADWGLYDSNGNLYDFANGFLKITNPASGWRDHFIRECVKMLDALAFDGVHVDQYGEPRRGFDAAGKPVNLWEAIADTLRALHQVIPAGKTLLFNLVHNEPLAEISRTPVDFLYCELWPPMVTLGDLAHVARLNRRQGQGRVPVIAVYMDPRHEHTVRLAQSVILASGAYHIAHGEDGLYLCDPYFPKAQRPSAELAEHLRRLADFGMAYEELLAFADPLDVQVRCSAEVWCIARSTQQRIVLNLINAAPHESWQANLAARSPRQNVQVAFTVSAAVHQVWWVSPDEDMLPQTLAFAQTGNKVEFVVPQVHYWTLVCLELEPGN